MVKPSKEDRQSSSRHRFSDSDSDDGSCSSDLLSSFLTVNHSLSKRYKQLEKEKRELKKKVKKLEKELKEERRKHRRDNEDSGDDDAPPTQRRRLSPPRGPTAQPPAAGRALLGNPNQLARQPNQPAVVRNPEQPHVGNSVRSSNPMIAVNQATPNQERGQPSNSQQNVAANFGQAPNYYRNAVPNGQLNEAANKCEAPRGSTYKVGPQNGPSQHAHNRAMNQQAPPGGNQARANTASNPNQGNNNHRNENPPGQYYQAGQIGPSYPCAQQKQNDQFFQPGQQNGGQFRGIPQNGNIYQPYQMGPQNTFSNRYSNRGSSPPLQNAYQVRQAGQYYQGEPYNAVSYQMAQQTQGPSYSSYQVRNALSYQSAHQVAPTYQGQQNGHAYQAETHQNNPTYQIGYAAVAQAQGTAGCADQADAYMQTPTNSTITHRYVISQGGVYCCNDPERCPNSGPCNGWLPWNHNSSPPSHWDSSQIIVTQPVPQAASSSAFGSVSVTGRAAPRAVNASLKTPQPSLPSLSRGRAESAIVMASGSPLPVGRSVGSPTIATLGPAHGSPSSPANHESPAIQVSPDRDESRSDATPAEQALPPAEEEDEEASADAVRRSFQLAPATEECQEAQKETSAHEEGTSIIKMTPRALEATSVSQGMTRSTFKLAVETTDEASAPEASEDQHPTSSGPQKEKSSTTRALEKGPAPSNSSRSPLQNKSRESQKSSERVRPPSSPPTRPSNPAIPQKEENVKHPSLRLSNSGGERRQGHARQSDTQDRTVKVVVSASGQSRQRVRSASGETNEDTEDSDTRGPLLLRHVGASAGVDAAMARHGEEHRRHLERRENRDSKMNTETHTVTKSIEVTKKLLRYK
ncbi:unnamed protein product [Caenorhabditis bovis]|uniref:Uncharacterized protein n=1 Tax=Caenorhabditis bovis TaxID=2654633 RepID=A0A8S1F027_9PELO|nr:unnamed protein product [Caenorhabditis bovis]